MLLRIVILVVAVVVVVLVHHHLPMRRRRRRRVTITVMGRIKILYILNYNSTNNIYA